MNKLITQIALFTAVTMLLSSCSKQLNMALTKRHYRSGYYVDFDIKNRVHTPPPINRLTKKAEKESQPISLVAIKPKSVMVVCPPPYTSKKTALSIQKNIHKKKKLNDDKVIEHVSSSQNYFTSNTPDDNHLNAKAETEHHVQVNVNVSFAVIVICAIFIPPLGVGLMYGIDSYFWIDLILTLLFFIPGMIFALVVVLM